MLPVHRTLSVVLTFQCNASCSECGTFSSPKAKGVIDEATITKTIFEAKSLGFEVVVFTGGEATLRWNMLKRLARISSDLGMVTRLVTNAVWAPSLEQAERKLRELMDCGLTEINFSTGDEHQRFVPVENIVYAINASERLGIVHRTMIETRSNNTFTKKKMLDHFDPTDRPHFDRLMQESPWMPMSPFHEYGYSASVPTATKENLHAYLGCESVLGTYVAYPEGTLSACCGLGSRKIEEMHVGKFSNGDLPVLSMAINESEEDLVKLALHFYGPFRILKWAQDFDKSVEWEGKFAHKCQACAKIYKDSSVREAVQAAINEHFEDIQFSASLALASNLMSTKQPSHVSTQ